MFVPPCVIFEDEQLLVVNKPAGVNTHAPSPHAGEGIYDWLRNREPRWADLAIIHRLDKETSGVLVFSKTPLTNRSLTDQFTKRDARKKYLLLSDCTGPSKEVLVRTALKRVGEKYVSRPLAAGGQIAETKFRTVMSNKGDVAIGIPSLATRHSSPLHLVEAQPLTGRTHQIRVHAAENGFPVLGDTLYGGTQAARMYLHAVELSLRHPVTGKEITFRASPDFGTDPARGLRAAIMDEAETNAFRLVHGASDGWPGVYVERLGDFLLCQNERALSRSEFEAIGTLSNNLSAHGVYHKLRTRKDRATGAAKLLMGEPASEQFIIRENGLQFEMSFAEGYSTGLFVDQRDNRRRLITGYIAPGFFLRSSSQSDLSILNTFAYTCGFSVCAAKSGFRTTSIDLSRKYLEWGKRNFALNTLDPASHDFLYGEVFDWLRRLARKQRLFDVILLDPPTFSASKESGAFQARKDYGRLMMAALPLLKPEGVIFASTNAADWPAEKFLECLESAVRSARRRILKSHYAPQPPDFPVSRAEPAYLKTVWLKIA